MASLPCAIHTSLYSQMRGTLEERLNMANRTKKMVIPNLKTDVGMSQSNECVAFPPLIFISILAFTAIP